MKNIKYEKILTQEFLGYFLNLLKKTGGGWLGFENKSFPVAMAN